MKHHLAVAVPNLAAALLWSVAAMAQSGNASDLGPVQTDPPRGTQPPWMTDVTIVSGGARMNGLVYLATGSGPHPVVIFLHGYPQALGLQAS
jgi:dipeptidyl aminopeptidase/acylaminoacyl peptidase